MKNPIILILLITISSLSVQGQAHKCGTMKNWNQKKENDPNVDLRMKQLEETTQAWISENSENKKTSTIITIPVVVHVLYHSAIENISDAQIYSQIDALNLDFRLLNEDSLQPAHPFWGNAADCKIEFCLAQQDPNGSPTTGITRTYTDSVSFLGPGYQKLDSTGGKNNWDPTKYLNIWVCNLGDPSINSTLGFATFPSDLSAEPFLDGVVIRHEAFGYVGTAGTGGWSENSLGRTATHEVGHWLNLSHIWGDTFCGDDFVSDTPEAEEANYGCPSFPHNAFNSCGTLDYGEMYMNYMDYVDDLCMVMFTFGQRDRMSAVLNNTRSGLLTSNGCSVPTNIEDINNAKGMINVFPNPSTGYLFLDIRDIAQTKQINITINNVLGETVYHHIHQNVTTDNFKLDLNNLTNGIYFVNIKSKNWTSNKRIVIHK